ncbi:PAS domain S-box protein [Sediminibacterium sp.]|uniref:PAS domain S-box protein n=1 Tax=Sediminibacterium sp. TaxID=1917865 RepID=UPI003F7021CA
MPTKKNKELLNVAETIAKFGTYEFNLNTQALICSAGVYTIFDWQENEPLPSLQSIVDQIHAEDKDAFLSSLLSAVKLGNEFSAPLRLYNKYQHLRNIIFTSSVKKSEEDNQLLVIGVIQDITDIKTKETTLLTIQNRLSKILNSSPDIICTLDEDGFFTSVSSACYNILGYTPEEMVGKNYKEFVYKGDYFKSQQAFQSFISGINIMNFENSYVTKNGALIPIIWSSYWDAEEKTMYCVARNGTEIKKQEATQIKNERRYRALVNNSSDAIMIFNHERKPVYASPSIYKVIGYTEEESLSINITRSIHSSDIRNLFREYLMSEENPGKTIEAKTIRFKNASNEWIIIELSFTNLINDPFIEGMVINFRDVTSRENALSELKLMESVVKHTSDAIIITEAEPFEMPGPRIIFVNEAFCRMTGYKKEDVIGKTPRILQGPKTDKAAIQKLSAAIKKWEKHETTLLNYKKNGDEFWINFAISPIANEKGWFTHWIAIERDVTEIKIVELEKILLADISKLFLKLNNLQELLQRTIQLILDSESFCMGEIWLLSASKRQITLTATAYNSDEMKLFFEETKAINQFEENIGLVGVAWNSKKIYHWENVAENELFSRSAAAKKYGLQDLYTIPLINGEQLIGILCLGISQKQKTKKITSNLLSQLSAQLSAEIIRKQIEIQLNNIFNSSLDLIIIAGLDGFVKKANPAAKDILEYDADEIINLPFTHFIHPDDEEITRIEADKLGKGQAVKYFENRLITKNGNVKWIAWTFTPSKEDNLIYGLGKDITEKKNLEDILNKSNKLARIGSWEINLNRGTVFWSDITKEIREVEPDFVPTMEIGISKFKEGFHRNTIQKRVEECIRSGTSWDEELLIETFKGNWKWVRSIGEGEFLNGKCIRVYGSFQDIDEKKKAQQEIIENNDRFNLVAKATNDLIWDWDILTGETLRLGSAFFENLGYVKNFTFTNKLLWLDLIHPEDLNRVEDKRNAIFDDPTQTYWEDQYRCKRADGTYAIVYDRGYIVRTSNGVALKMIGSTQDISKLKQTEIELAELNQQLTIQAKDLALSNKELENFAYIASHDLQEPLRMISSFLSQIEKKYGEILDEKGKKYIFFAVDGAKRMRQIILDLLEFSRVGRQELKEELINVRGVLDDILDLYKKQIEEKNAVFEIGSMPMIITYKATFRQIMQNLISNALKYQQSNNHPIINIKCQQENSYWKFSIQDNGIGIEAEFHDKIFEIFQRLHSKEAYSGTGIGLAIVKKIIEGQGGKIYLVSKKGEGSIFNFTLPIKNPQSNKND